MASGDKLHSKFFYWYTSWFKD